MIKERFKAILELPNRYLVFAGFGLGTVWSSIAFTSLVWFIIGTITYLVFLELYMLHRIVEEEKKYEHAQRVLDNSKKDDFKEVEE